MGARSRREAQAADGTFRNRLGGDRRWRGRPEAQDAWGRALVMLDQKTGGCSDALSRADRSRNQGAEAVTWC